MGEIGKAVLGIGLVFVVIGVFLLVAARVGIPFGRLLGDFAFRRRNISVFFPLGTSILISIVLSAVFYLVARFRR